MTYTTDEVLVASTKYFNGDTLAADVFLKYALCSSPGVFEELTPDDLHRRVALEIDSHMARGNTKPPQTVYNWLKDFKYICLQGSPMAAINNPYVSMSASNCYVIDAPEDSYGGILRADQELVQISKRRGGVGFNVNTLRPAGMATKNAALTSTGLGPFLHRFSNSTREVAQEGRRGALMLMCSIHHPDIETFITIKQNLKDVTGANLTVQYTDEFLEAVENCALYEQRFPIDPNEERQISKWVDAKALFLKIVHSAWLTGEPGAQFVDTVDRYTPGTNYAEFKPVATNPCGEILLSAYGSCLLVYLNLVSYVVDPFTKKARFDYTLFRLHADKAQRILDAIVDIEIGNIKRILEKISQDPEPQTVKNAELDLWQKILKQLENGRRTGLGITGLGDTIAMLGMEYGDASSVEFTSKMYQTLAIGAYSASIDLAEERGAFPSFDHAKDKCEFIDRILSILSPKYVDKYYKYGRRNVACLTTAPVGSGSCLTQTTSGCEALFALKYKRNRKVTDKEAFDYTDVNGDKYKTYDVYHRGVELWKEITGETDIEKSPYANSLASTVHPLRSVAIQAAAQEWICHAISKTVNLPKDATVDDVYAVYMEAWKSKCKGITVYREGSRKSILTTSTFEQHDAVKRPEYLDADLHSITVGSRNYHILVGLLEGKPYEIFGGDSAHGFLKSSKRLTIRKHTNKTVAHRYSLLDDGVTIESNLARFFTEEASEYTRAISMLLRHGAKSEYIVRQLKKSGFGTFNKALGRVLSKYSNGSTDEKCPNCEDALIFQEGCVKCLSCGYSKC